MRKPLTQDFAKSVYAILVEAGAEPQWLDNFLHHFTGDDPPSEWRFCGKLGFGGKLRYRDYEEPPLHVDCYPEDNTKQRQTVIDDTNSKLEALTTR